MDLSVILHAAQSPDKAQREQAEATLQQYEKDSFGPFAGALAQALNDETKDPNSRQLAGLQLKNMLTARDEALKADKALRWLALDAAMRTPIKTCAMGALKSPAPQAAAAGAQVVARLGAIEMPASQWPELPAELQALVSGPQASSDTAKACALDEIGFLCEDVDEDALPPGSVDALLTPIVFGMQPAAPGADTRVRESATRALLNSLSFTKANFEKDAERDAIMGAVLAAMAPPAQPPTGAEAPEAVRVAAYECAARVVELYYDKVGPYIHKLFELTVGAIRGGEGEPVVLQAIEFWTAMCEEEDDILSEQDEFSPGALPEARQCHNYIAGAFEHLLPLLLTNTLTQQDEGADDNEWNVAAAGAVCLGSITYTCGNLAEVSKNSAAVEKIVQTVLAFVQGNIQHAEWRNREAAVMAFCQILEGTADLESMKVHVQTALPMLIHLFAKGDEHILVRDTAVFTISEVCRLHTPALVDARIDRSLFTNTITTLGTSLVAEPRLAARACAAVYNCTLACAELEGAEGTALAQHVAPLLEQLWPCAERADGAEANLRQQAYEAMTELVQYWGRDDQTRALVPLDLVTLLQEVLRRLQASFAELDAARASSRDGVEAVSGKQQALCALVQVIVRALPKETAAGQLKGALADHAMTLLLKVFDVKGPIAMEEAFMAIGAVATSLGPDFASYMALTHPVLVSGLQQVAEYQLCQAAVGTTGDICRALERGMMAASGTGEPFCDSIVGVLLTNLQNQELHRQVKPHMLSCFGDIALAVGGDFERYLSQVLVMLASASQTTMPGDDDELIEYLNALRESVLEAYTGLIQGLNDHGKAGLLVTAANAPHVNAIFELATRIVADEAEGQVEEAVLKAAIGVIGDLAMNLKGGLGQFLKHHEQMINALITRGASGDYGDDISEMTRWAQSHIHTARTAAGA